MKKIKFYKGLLIELIETLCTICLYLESDSRYTYNQHGVHFRSHFNELKYYSEVLRNGKTNRR